MTSGRSSPMARSGCWRSKRRAATNARPSDSPGERSRLPQRRATPTGSGAFSTSATAPRCSRSLRRWTARFPFRPRHFKPSLDSQRLAEAFRAGRGPSHSGRAVTDREMACDSDLEELASQQRHRVCLHRAAASSSQRSYSPASAVNLQNLDREAGQGAVRA
jgi:hypothetical protein